VSSSALETPLVVVWYQTYCAAVAALWATGTVLSVGLVVWSGRVAEAWSMDPIAAVLFSVTLLLVMLFLTAVHIAGHRTANVPGTWNIHAIVLGLDLTTLFLWPAALPLLWFWLKPETRAWYLAGLPEPQVSPSDETSNAPVAPAPAPQKAAPAAPVDNRKLPSIKQRLR
jgi:hypothetical protein